jgi:hypothetical protein
MLTLLRTHIKTAITCIELYVQTFSLPYRANTVKNNNLLSPTFLMKYPMQCEFEGKKITNQNLQALVCSVLAFYSGGLVHCRQSDAPWRSRTGVNGVATQHVVMKQNRNEEDIASGDLVL